MAFCMIHWKHLPFRNNFYVPLKRESNTEPHTFLLWLGYPDVLNPSARCTFTAKDLMENHNGILSTLLPRKLVHTIAVIFRFHGNGLTSTHGGHLQLTGVRIICETIHTIWVANTLCLISSVALCRVSHFQIRLRNLTLKRANVRLIVMATWIHCALSIWLVS